MCERGSRSRRSAGESALISASLACRLKMLLELVLRRKPLALCLNAMKFLELVHRSLNLNLPKNRETSQTCKLVKPSREGPRELSSDYVQGHLQRLQRHFPSLTNRREGIWFIEPGEIGPNLDEPPEDFGKRQESGKPKFL